MSLQRMSVADKQHPPKSAPSSAVARRAQVIQRREARPERMARSLWMASPCMRARRADRVEVHEVHLPLVSDWCPFIRCIGATRHFPGVL